MLSEKSHTPSLSMSINLVNLWKLLVQFMKRKCDLWHFIIVQTERLESKASDEINQSLRPQRLTVKCHFWLSIITRIHISLRGSGQQLNASLLVRNWLGFDQLLDTKNINVIILGQGELLLSLDDRKIRAIFSHETFVRVTAITANFIEILLTGSSS